MVRHLREPRRCIRALVAILALALPGAVLGQQDLAEEDLTAEVVTEDLDGDGSVETVVIFRDAEGRAQRAEAADGTPAREDIPALCRAYTLGD